MADVVGDSARPKSSELDAADADRCLGEQFTGPPGLLSDLEAGLTEMANLDADREHVVETRRATIAHRRLAHDEGDAGVAAAHALVLVNHGHASGAQLLDLARRIAGSVQARFGVAIEPEPRIIGDTW